MKSKIMMVYCIGLILALTVVPVSTHGAVPQQINYQGYLTDSDGSPVPDGDYVMSFAIYDVSTGGSPLWSEAQTVTVTKGIYNVILGQNPFPPDLFNGDLYLGVTVGTDAEMTPRQKLTSTAFALKAEKADDADTLDGKDSTELDQSAHAVRTDNPHNVTASQTGAATNSDITWGNLSNIPVGFADGVDNEGIATETDPTVLASVKDGVSWGEIFGIPTGFADGVDNTGITTETDPTVPASIKDGISWSEVSSRPAGLDDGDDVGITSESDPQVGTILNDRVPRWNGSSLVTGAIYDDGSKNVSFDGSISVNGSIMGTQNEGRLVLKTPSHNSNYAIKFDNTYLGVFMGDDTEAQNFNFFSGFSSTRNYDAHLKVFGKASGSWGKYIELTHDGANGHINTDTGDINVEPGNGNVFSVIGDRDDSSIIANFRNNSATKWTAIDINGRDNQDTILYFSNEGYIWWSLGNRIDTADAAGHFELRNHRDGSDSVALEITSWGPSSDWAYYIKMHGTTYPSVDNDYSLGLQSLRWYKVYSANGVSTTSDSRLKENVDNLEYGLDEIMSLRPVSFQWKKDKEKNRKIGLIAQEVNLQVPEVVDIPETEEGTWGITYGALVPVLIKAIQEQQDQIDELTSRIQKLEKRAGGSHEKRNNL